MSNKNIRKKRFFYLVLIVTTLLIFSGAIILSLITTTYKNNEENESTIIQFKNNVEIVNTSTGEKELVNLPKKMPSGEYALFITLPEQTPPEPYIYINGKYLAFSASCNGEVFYDYTPQDTNIIKSGGIFVRIFKIPDNYLDKKIKLSFRPAFDSSYGVKIPCVYIGSKNNILINNPEKSIPVFLYVVFMIVFSVVSFIILLILIINKKIGFEILLVPFFSLISAGYLVAPTPPLYIVTGKGVFLYTMEYTLFMLQPLCIALFVLSIFKFNKTTNRKKRMIRITSYILMLNLILQIITTYFGIIEFMEMKKFTYASMLFLAITLLLLTFSKNSKEKRNIPTTMMIFIISVTFIIGLIDFTFFSRVQSGYVMTIPSIVFILLQLWIAITTYSKNFRELSKIQIYKELAFRDPLTRLFNRNAIERDLAAINKENGGTLLLMIIDINNLKFINNSQDHQTNNHIIRATGDILRNTKDSLYDLRAYRIGDDEFAILCINPKKNYEHTIRNHIESEITHLKKSEPDLALSIAIGTTTVDISPSFNPKELAIQADKNMYNNKKTKKIEL